MKIITWNILVSNKDIENAVNHVFEQNADIVCLQEVSHTGLDYIKSKQGYEIHYLTTAEGIEERRNVYKVILSRMPIIHRGHIKTEKQEINTPWKKVVKRLYGLKELYTNGIYIDTEKERIFNLHLDSYASPIQRIEELQNSLKHLDGKKTNIVCGDFNTYGNWFLNIGLLFIQKLGLNHLFYNERKHLNTLIEQYNLKNIFSGISTWPLAGIKIQPDHILIPNNVSVKSKEVIKQRYRSDHRMLIADLEI